MPRSEARVFTSIWEDEGDFVGLSPDAKLLYLFLLSQPGLGHSGVITITAQRWARKIGWGSQALRVAMGELARARYIVVDEMTEELLIRSLIRRDGIWRQPRTLKAALREAAMTESPTLRAAITVELRRLNPAELDKARGEVTFLLSQLPERLASAVPEGGAEPPPEPPPDGAREAPPEPPRNPPAEPHREAPRDPRPEGVRGRGNGYGGYVGDAPFPQAPAPSPPAPSAAAAAPPRPLFPCAVPDPQAGEGEESGQAGNPTEADLGALVAAVRKTRPDWSSRSISRALADPSVLERGWDRVQQAMLAVAADPQSKHPGRLAADGDWWCQGTPAAGPPPRPPWCGDPDCDPATRMRGMHSDQPSRCTECGGGTPARRAS